MWSINFALPVYKQTRAVLPAQITTLTTSPIKIRFKKNRHQVMACRYVPTRVGHPPKSQCTHTRTHARSMPSPASRLMSNTECLDYYQQSIRDPWYCSPDHRLRSSISRAHGSIHRRCRGQGPAMGGLIFMAELTRQPYPCDENVLYLLRAMYVQWSTALRAPFLFHFHAGLQGLGDAVCLCRRPRLGSRGTRFAGSVFRIGWAAACQ